MKRSSLLLLVLSVALASSGTAGDGEWVSIFNGKDLTGWTPKFSGHPLGTNYKDTFRVEDGLFTVSYENWDEFDGAFSRRDIGKKAL